MAGITGMGTTFDLPNYHGELFALSPKDTPLLSAIGGLTGGAMATSREFEWQAYDLRAPGPNVQVEGAAAPTAVARKRENVKNVAEIHQSKVSTSYTKQATPGMYTTPSTAPFVSPGGAANPVVSEHDWQVAQEIAQIALDVDWAFINGVYANPSTNGAPRQTRGLIEAVASNVANKGTVHSGLSTATDTITETSTTFANDDPVLFLDVDDATGVQLGTVYYVVGKTTSAFKVAATKGGTAITLGTATVDILAPSTTDLADTVVGEFVQGIFDNGGLTGGDSVFLVNSRQRRALSTAFKSNIAGAGGPQTETVGGVRVDLIRTDFGDFGIMLDRHVPQDAILALTMSQLDAVLLNVPGKGVFFEEALAKTGASDDTQIYGEIGLKYGNEAAHGVLRGLKL